MASTTPSAFAAEPVGRLAGRRVRGTCWDGDRLSWVDTGDGQIRWGRWEGDRLRHLASLSATGRLTAAAPTATGWVVGAETTHLGRDGLATALALPAADGLWCDPAGRLWLDTSGALHRVDLGGGVHRVLAGRTQALAWTADAAVLLRALDDAVVAHDFDLVNGLPGPARPVLDQGATALAADDAGRVWAVTAAGVLHVDPHAGVRAVVHPLTAPATGCCLLDHDLLITAADGVLHRHRVRDAGRPVPRASAPRPVERM
ncbi:SMP-30/gluconolactonase/LRE family protein [Actinokineospora bangkokensis]|uniref:SMP-30/Gluconolactonase/LRE-like region domain-containing protein n=1 Tax=Actinokineospora bangkokensis TaxID=1193682 RepID=A0A1Q9LHB9_9PSEU|nr:SMP-30/gluconolactonase/LRE family protein [Actinokineospora bangkokensis]OLR91339.1 hypothetical protein BJP25_27125 [Actinokineospora bangkokensis]